MTRGVTVRRGAENTFNINKSLLDFSFLLHNINIGIVTHDHVEQWFSSWGTPWVHEGTPGGT